MDGHAEEVNDKWIKLLKEAESELLNEGIRVSRYVQNSREVEMTYLVWMMVWKFF